jgi:hypothetical protein
VGDFAALVGTRQRLSRIAPVVDKLNAGSPYQMAGNTLNSACIVPHWLATGKVGFTPADIRNFKGCYG